MTLERVDDPHLVYGAKFMVHLLLKEEDGEVCTGFHERQAGCLP